MENLDADAKIDFDIDIDPASDHVSNTPIVIDRKDKGDICNSETFRHFKILLQNNSSLEDALVGSAKLMNMLTLSCDKGSITIEHKYKSRSECWFMAKKSLSYSNIDEPQPNQSLATLRHDRIIQLCVRRGGHERVVEYRALAFFIKFYNKWFISMPTEFQWQIGNVLAIPKGRVSARLVKKSGATYIEVKGMSIPYKIVVGPQNSDH